MLGTFEERISDGRILIRHLTKIFILAAIAMDLSYRFFDHALAQFFRHEDNLQLWIYAREVTNIGWARHYFIFVFGGLLLVHWKPNVTSRIFFEKFHADDLKIWFWNFLSALLFSGVVLHLFKFMVGRQRPTQSPDSAFDVFVPMNHDWNFQSWPSGHTQVLFTVATMVCLVDQKRKWMWFSMAFFFSLSRVMTYSHFLSDVIGGAFIGYASTLYSLHLINRYTHFSWLKNEVLK